METTKETVIIKSLNDYIAYHSGGFRERYAMEHGTKEIVYVNGHKCFKYTYDHNAEYQDANGATYDIIAKKWID